MSRERDGRRAVPPSPPDEEKLAPGPFEELFLKPARPLDLDDTSPATRDVFAREGRPEADVPPRDRESVIFSPFTPTSSAPPPFPQPEPPPPPETGVFKPAPPSFEKLVEELVPAPEAEEEPPPPRRRRNNPAIAWAVVAVVVAAAGGAWLLRDRLGLAPAASTGAVEPAAPPAVGEALPRDEDGAAPAVADDPPAGEPVAAPQAATVPESAAAPPPAPAVALAGVSWRAVPVGTEVIIRADGFLAPERVQVNVLASPPRVLVRLARLFPGTVGEQRTVGTGEVERIRLGYHGELSPPQLYVVLDLPSPAVALGEHAVEGDAVRLVLRRPRAL